MCPWPRTTFAASQRPGRWGIAIPGSSDTLRGSGLVSSSADSEWALTPVPLVLLFFPRPGWLGDEVLAQLHRRPAQRGTPEWESSFLLTCSVDPPPGPSWPRLYIGRGLHRSDRSPGGLSTRYIMDGAVLWMGEQVMGLFPSCRRAARGTHEPRLTTQRGTAGHPLCPVQPVWGGMLPPG